MPSRASCNEFKNWSDAGNLIHLGTKGAEFTWSNCRRGLAHTERRLDRVVCNQDWLSLWSNSVCYTLVRSKSDHHPIMFNMQQDYVTYSSSFKFMKMWASHPDCHKIVSDSWNTPIFDCPMFILSQKLKNLKTVLKIWNKGSFGDVNKNVEKATKELENVQALITDEGSSEDLVAQEQLAQIELNKALHFQEDYWREKYRVNWHCFGDRNTAFFHRLTKIRHVKNKISVLRSGIAILDQSVDIEDHKLEFYKNLFAADNECRDSGLIEEVIEPLVSYEDNEMLTKLSSWFEVKDAVFGMKAEGAPGPNGFGGFFYQKYWDIVGKDVFNAIRKFFRQGWILPNINANNVVLIPKVANADVIGQFRPISLANYQFKIITKVMATRLVKIASKIISVNQRGFINGRNISD